MSAIGSDLTPWSRGRWWGMIVIVAAVQVVVVFLLGDREVLVPRKAGSASAFTLLSNPSPGSSVGELVQYLDPTLFALPDSRGFSGGAWLLPQRIDPPAFGWTEPDRWLTQSVAELGAAIDQFGRQYRLRYRTFDEKPPPALSQVKAPPVPFPVRTMIRVESAGDRVLVSLPNVPSVTHADVLADTLIQAGISPSGLTLSSVVLSGSGSEVADGLALDASRLARFKPLASRDPLAVTWAVLSFRWHAVAPPDTNAVPAATPP